MAEGKTLLKYIENQKKAKTKIAADLGMSRRNLYQLFESKTLADETKKKFEDYFEVKIFDNNVNAHVISREISAANTEQDAVINMLLLEIAKLKAKVLGISVTDAIDELEKNARIALRQIEKGGGA